MKILRIIYPDSNKQHIRKRKFFTDRIYPSSWLHCVCEKDNGH